MDQGWTDALRHQFPAERIYTFWDYFRNHWQSDSGLRIDHILLSPTLKQRLKDTGVDRFVRADVHASDHAPVWVELSDGDVRKRSAVKRRTHTRVRWSTGED